MTEDRRSPLGGALARLVEEGALRPVDAELAEALVRRAGEEGSPLGLAAARLLRAEASGDVCLAPAQYRGDPAPGPPGAPLPTPSEWEAALAGSALVSDDGRRPLVLEADGRLYLQRNWLYERRVAGLLAARAEPVEEAPDPETLARVFGQWLPPSARSPGGRASSQAVAAVLVALRKLVVITGGPGTGKTTALARLMGLLAELAPQGRMRMALAAPTGKGAHRARAALAAAASELPMSEPARARLPAEAVTLHRLLGARRGQEGFRHDRRRPLPLDALFVDEASMVDLRLMAHLLDALPAHARLVLLGDPDQLASVEAGAVLAEVCDAAGGLSAELAAYIGEVAGEVPDRGPEGASGDGLADVHVVFRERYRFAGDDALGELADAVRAGRAERALDLLSQSPDLDWQPLEGHGAEPVVAAALDGYAPYLAALEAGAGAEGVLAALGAFQVLSPFRYGPLGTGHLNRMLERRLSGEARAGLEPVGGRHGQPIIVVRNDYDAELYNGDVGVVLAEREEPRAYFPGMRDGVAETRAYVGARLPACELAYALTVHKAQGSEYERVMLVVPARIRHADEPALSRQLLYTAITRARRGVTIWAEEAALVEAIETPVRRASGLGRRLRALGADRVLRPGGEPVQRSMP